MHAVILAAGDGSRLGDHTPDLPKAFLSIAGRTLYDRQRTALAGHVDDVTIVLGYAAERVSKEITSARTVRFEEWAAYENAESLRRGIAGVDDDVLVLNGDVIVTESAVSRVVERHRSVQRSVVACLPGTQEGETALQCDDRGIVTDYGLIQGHRHAGLGVIDRHHLPAVREFLRANRHEWYPGLYTVVETEMVPIPASHHIEINYPADLATARRKLPLDGPDELDLQT